MQTWWKQPSSTRIPTIILGLVLISLRIYLSYKRLKAVHRSPDAAGMERNIPIALWSFIALASLVLFLTGRFG